MLIITGTGRLGRDAETRQAGSSVVTSFSVACDGFANGEKTTTWVDCSLWGARGERVAQYLTKGAIVSVAGRGALELYTKRDGSQGAKVTCNVSEFTFAGGGERDAPREQAPGAPPAGKAFSDDDVPF